MKNLERYIWGFVALVLIVMLLLERCNRGKTDPAGTVSITTSVRVDTIPGKSVYHEVPAPYPVYLHDTAVIHDTAPGKPYPVEVIKEKLIEAQIPLVYYPDTLWLGNKGYVAVKDTVQGLLLARSFDWHVFQTNTTTKEVKLQKQPTKLYIGLDYTYPINYLGASVILQMKNDNLIRVGYGFANKQGQYSFGFYPKIKLK